MYKRNGEYVFRKGIYDMALEHYGWDTQLIIAVEELSEAQKEICKFFRCEGDIEHLAEEIADAFIMLEQTERIFKISEKVTEKMREKVSRLKKRIEEDKGV
jgi:L-arabinose isomerase